METENTRQDGMDNSSAHTNRSTTTDHVPGKGEINLSGEVEAVGLGKMIETNNDQNQEAPKKETLDVTDVELKNPQGSQTMEQIFHEGRAIEPAFDAIESPEQGTPRNLANLSLEPEQDGQMYAWPEKAVALKNFVKEKGAEAVSTVLRRLSGRKEDDDQVHSDEEESNDKEYGGEEESGHESKPKENSGEQSAWNPLAYIKVAWDNEIWGTNMAEDVCVEHPKQEPIIKGIIIIYTKLRCQDSKEVRLFMHQKRLKYIEINIDIYPSRKIELEKNTGSPAVPRIYFNDLLIGGLAELKALDETGKLDEKIKYIVNDEPSPAAPQPPLPGEDDVSGEGVVDELATILKKMKETIIVKDRFYKMRRFSNCFLGSEAVDFLSEDQYLEREEAVEFGRKLVAKHFFQHVLDEDDFEDGNHLYRFLEHDPIVISQCYNIPRGILDVKPKPGTEIASRLRLLSYAIFEAYASEDGKHVDYRSIHGSEEFRRYTRIIQELHRMEMEEMSREEKLSFFINLYNMMAIHAILTWGYPDGALNRRKYFGDFKYVIGGCVYSLSAIHNGILRGNQRPPYNLTKPFGPKDKRIKVALPYPEPLVHFALVSGARSGPALRCYSPGNIDQELMEAARHFLRNGGITFDTEARVVSASKIFRWFSVDFGDNEVEVIKHAANYLEPSDSEKLLGLLANSQTQLKMTYQTYDWGLNC